MPLCAQSSRASVLLPLAGGPADRDELRATCPPSEPQRLGEALAGALAAVPGAYEVDLRADEGAVARHGGQQCGVAGVAPGGAVAVDERSGEPRRRRHPQGP